MAGHSHWSNIQHKKAAKDAKKGKVLSRLVKLLHTAVKEGGGGDPDANPRLRLILEKCRLANMPKDNIKRAIEKATSGGGGYETMIFEGYGPAGAAILVECLTDNTGRTAPEIRYIFDRHGGRLGKPGSVAHMFAKKGVFRVDKDRAAEDALTLLALDAGAEDVVAEDDFHEITCDPALYLKMAEALAAAGVESSFSELQHIPSNRVELDLEDARKMIKLIDLIEEHEDTQGVYTNFDLTAEAAEAMAKES